MTSRFDGISRERNESKKTVTTMSTTGMTELTDDSGIRVLRFLSDAIGFRNWEANDHHFRKSSNEVSLSRSFVRFKKNGISDHHRAKG
jgi:hypothetical protein